MPSIELKTLDGGTVGLDSLRGDVIIINLWATWCGYCREEMPALQSYLQRHKQEGLRVFAVSMDEPSSDKDVREILKPFGFVGARGRDSQLAALGRIWRLPMTFVIDRKGILRRDGSSGPPKVDLTVLEQEVTPWLKEP